MTDGIKVTAEFGIIIRRAALEERGIASEDLLSAFQASKPLDLNAELVSFGPSFGKEALDTFIQRLRALGLIYFDDFIEFAGDFPGWCKFRAVLG
jgi:hypothetical protein